LIVEPPQRQLPSQIDPLVIATQSELFLHD
jgi:hypothetical protein